jgi:alkanesulfonate monooxygenase SsuD/methylene tetrahydromethanopterin reductase-like flavin-dependent oxidoreductase (luciferase family)
MRALRRGLAQDGEDFLALLEELRTYLGAERPGQLVKAIPGQNSNVPITLLGSSDFSAQLAAALGLPFAFAAHFAPVADNAAVTIEEAGDAGTEGRKRTPNRALSPRNGPFFLAERSPAKLSSPNSILRNQVLDSLSVKEIFRQLTSTNGKAA